MNIVKTLLAASIALAFAFTVSCSDDKDDTPSSKKEKWCVMGISPYLTCAKIGVEHANAIAASMATEDGCSKMSYAKVVEGPQKKEDCPGGYYDGTETE